MIDHRSAPAFQIVVVLYDSAERIVSCVRSIGALQYTSHRLWIIDNASRDSGVELARGANPRAEILRGEYNRGFAGGCNWGAEQESESEFIFFVNPDVETRPDCLTRLAEAFAREPRLGVAGCKILDASGKIIQHVGGEIRGNGLPYHIGEGETDEGQYQGLRPSTYVQGAALAVRRNVWEALGGFDEGFFPAYFEEADFCRRAREAGWEVATVCEAAVLHHQQPAEQIQSRRFLEYLFRGRARYLLKHYRPVDWMARYLPAEAAWLLSRDSKRYRRIALRTLWEAWTGTPMSDDGIL